jgi:hypothetical protein
MFISPTVMAILTVGHFFTGQRPKTMTILVSFTVTLLAFIYMFTIRREKRLEAIRSRIDNLGIREILDLVVTSSGSVIVDKRHRYAFTDIKPPPPPSPPPPYDQLIIT